MGEIDALTRGWVKEEDGGGLSGAEEEPSMLGGQAIHLALELGDFNWGEASCDGFEDSVDRLTGKSSEVEQHWRLLLRERGHAFLSLRFSISPTQSKRMLERRVSNVEVTSRMTVNIKRFGLCIADLDSEFFHSRTCLFGI